MHQSEKALMAGADPARETNRATPADGSGRVVESLCQPIPLAGGEAAQIGASVGIALCCADGETLDGLLRKADAALYAAKRDGKRTFREAAAAGV